MPNLGTRMGDSLRRWWMDRCICEAAGTELPVLVLVEVRGLPLSSLTEHSQIWGGGRGKRGGGCVFPKFVSEFVSLGLEGGLGLQ